MRTWLLFLCDGKEQMGMDAWYPIDGRIKNSYTIHSIALKQMARLAIIKPHYNGYKIMKGNSLGASKAIYEMTITPIVYED